MLRPYIVRPHLRCPTVSSTSATGCPPHLAPAARSRSSSRPPPPPPRQRAERGEDVVLAGLSSTADSITEERPGDGRLRIVRLRATPYDRAGFRPRALWTARTAPGRVCGLR